MQIGSTEHKELFCRSFLESHRAYEPADLPWPELDALSLARLRAIPIWKLALEIEVAAGVMLGSGILQMIGSRPAAKPDVVLRGTPLSISVTTSASIRLPDSASSAWRATRRCCPSR